MTVPPPDSPTLITGKGPPARVTDTGAASGGQKGAIPPGAGAPGAETGEWLEGKFRLMEKLGEGGFGLVYKAEQTQPIHRFVAVKVLKAGMDTRQVIARFETERQSLALMEHPNIARVLDAGETAAGQPYFVMELVRGMSITRHTREKQLPLRARLELFIPVCHAVNHAHQKGIIHRDLKPSNVMVMEEDGAPVPKVIDFGIAKVLEQKDASQTLATGMDQLVGTPGYISPEQIQHGSSRVDTRSDVYALGSILLELLTGRGLVTPMDLAHKPIHLILRDQVELDPPRPSSRDPDLKGDLDWITLKALERDPARRYGSADDLADDLRRFLDHQPVRARPPSRRYLLEKFVRRHRVGVAASAAIALAVLGGGVTSTALYLQAERNQRLLIKSYSRSDEQMARQLSERADHSEAVARLCRALRTDPENGPAAVNLLSLLQHVHLLHPLTPELPLPEGMTSARLTALSPQTRRLLALGSVSEDGGKNDTLCVWDTGSHARRDFPLPSGVLATGLLATPDGAHAILTRDDGQIELLTLPGADRAPLLPPLPGGAASLALSGDGLTLAVGGERGHLHVWDLRQPARPATVLPPPPGAGQPLQVVALDHLGTLAVSAAPLADGQGGQARVWDLLERAPIGDPFETSHGISALVINREQEMLVVGLHSGLVHVGNFRSQTEILPPLVHPGSILGLCLATDGGLLHIGDGQGYLHCWDLRAARPAQPAVKHDGEIIATHQAPGQSLLAAVSRHGELHLWDTRTGSRARLRLPRNIAEAGLSADASLLAAAPALAPHVQLWSIHQRMTTRRWLAPPEDAAPAADPGLPPGLFDKDTLLARSPDRAWTAAAARDGSVTLFDSASWRARATFQHPPAIGALALSADGSLAVTSGRDQRVLLWEARTGRPSGIVLRFQTFVPALALSPDAARLVTLTDDGELRVWDTATGDALTPAIRQGADIQRLSVSPDGRQILFHIPGEGAFSLPMPPPAIPLPPWFLDLAEALARRRIDAQGRTETLGLPARQRAAAAVPAQPAPGAESVSARWAAWLLAPAGERPLSPQGDEPLAAYLRALSAHPHPAARQEAERLSR